MPSVVATGRRMRSFRCRAALALVALAACARTAAELAPFPCSQDFGCPDGTYCAQGTCWAQGTGPTVTGFPANPDAGCTLGCPGGQVQSRLHWCTPSNVCSITEKCCPIREIQDNPVGNACNQWNECSGGCISISAVWNDGGTGAIDCR
ncbi:MAG: hypothetical protein ACXWLR_11990 [Myxococcales bacterium]